MKIASVLVIPGLSNSGPEHWQSLWQTKHPEYHRLQQADWETPRCDDWVQTLHAWILQIDGPIVLAAHSLGCATIAHYATKHGDCEGRVAAALLVAPSDVEAPTYPPGSTGFDPVPLRKLPFRSVVVASTDDPYVTLERAEFFARSWGSPLIQIADAGHINTASGHGPWPEGEAWLEQLREIQT
jgi:predicted alpha/beta hydrolase family esterase